LIKKYPGPSQIYFSINSNPKKLLKYYYAYGKIS
jgi:hypothetical protein